jgi:hypothetical protein
VRVVPDRSDEPPWELPPELPGPSEFGRSDLDDDRALARLEDLLLSVPFDRALPELAELLRQAGLSEDLLARDERVLKVLHEAILARPLGRLEEVTRIRAEVELLTLETELLADRLADPSADELVTARAVDRLAEVRARLDEVRAQI